MKKDIATKRKKEKEVIQTMVGIYCRGNHNNQEHASTCCEECETLLQYAFTRIDKCPFMEEKTFCSTCRVHCYQKAMRTQMKQVMKYAGPRMLFVRPDLVIKHAYNTLKYKGNSKK